MLLAAVPALTRESAADAARRELGRHQYADARPSLIPRLIGRGLHWLGDLLSRATGTPGQGLLSRVLLLLLLAVVVAVVLVRLGPLGSRNARRPSVFDGSRLRTAAEHRAEAEELAGQGRHAEAVRERLRAVVRELEARGVLDPRPGRTAGEVARDGGAAVPGLAGDLRRAAGVFDEVWYGGRPAGPQSYAVLVEVDDRVRGARLGVA